MQTMSVARQELSGSIAAIAGSSASRIDGPFAAKSFHQRSRAAKVCHTTTKSFYNAEESFREAF